MWTFYDELGVKKTATPEDIERAYRILARKFHPDRNPGREADAKARFVRVQEAYEILSNPTLRVEYDETFEAGDTTDIAVDRAPFVDLHRPPQPRRRTPYGAHTVWVISAAIGLGMLTTIVFLARTKDDQRSVSSGAAAPQTTPSLASGAHGKRAATMPVRTPGAASERGDQETPEETQTLGSSATMPKENATQAVTSEESVRWPVPDDAAQDAARKQITQLYLPDLNSPVAGSSSSGKAPDEAVRGQSRRQRSQLAAKLLSVASETHDDPAVRFVLCDVSAELAAGVGDCGAAWKALAEMGRSFDVDLLPKKECAAKLGSNWATSAAEHKYVAQYWLALVVDAAAQHLYAQAETFLANATREANLTSDNLLRRALQESAGQLREMSAAYDRAHPYEERLALNPQDSEAAQQWGRYLCLYQNDWTGGLPLLATNPNQGLSKIADQDLDNPVEPGKQIGLAIAWQDAARGEPDSLPKRAMSLRAALWYGRAVAKLPAYLQPATAAHVQEIVNQLSPVRVGETVDLLATIEPDADAIDGAWRPVGRELINDHQAGRLIIPIAISHDGSYELELEFTHRGNSFHSGEFLVFPTGDADWSIALQSRGGRTPSGAVFEASYRGRGVGGRRSAPLNELTPDRRHRFKVTVELIANQTAKIRCELDGTVCFDGQEPLPKLSFAQSSRLQEGAIILSANANRPSDSTIYHTIRLRMNSGSARPLSNVAAFKLGLLEAGDPKRPGAIQSAASQPVSDTPATELSFFDPLAGIQAAAFSFMPIELDDAAAR